MSLTQTEQQFILWAFGILLGILAFIGALAVNALMKISNDVHELKTDMKVNAANLKNHEAHLDYLERRVVIIEEKLS